MSNPDYDYPCNKVFFETDEQYARRFKRMDVLKRELVELTQSYYGVQAVIDAEITLISELEKFKDSVYGWVKDDQFKAVLDFSLKTQRKLAEHKERWYSLEKRVKATRKELSELTR
jgi:BMFP domain-containing protein YqiC